MKTRTSRRRFLGVGLAGLAAGWTTRKARAAEVPERAETEKTLRAGAAMVDVTPQKFPVIVNGGVAERTADRAIDPLNVRCLVLDDGTGPIAIATVDNCMVPRALLDQAKELARQATGIATERMLISATHTHSAPSVVGCLGSDCDEDYAALLPGRIAAAIEAAQKNLAPARIGWAMGEDPTNVFCRRFLMKPGTALTNRFSDKRDDRAQMNPGYLNPNAVRPTGRPDPQVAVLSVQTPEGRPIALLSNYSTHYVGSPAVSADYFAVFATRIGQLLGAGDGSPPFVGMMSNGTSGDANCCNFPEAPRRFDRFTVAEDVAQAALKAYKTIRHHDRVPIAMRQKLLELNVRMPTEKEVAEAKEFMKTFAGRKPRNWIEVYARETVLLDAMPPTRELKLQAIRIGSLGITAIPNEVFSATGLAIKAASPLKPTFNISLANGGEGYLAPPDQHELGGYTTWRARTSCLEVDAEPKIRAAVLGLLESVADHDSISRSAVRSGASRP